TCRKQALSLVGDVEHDGPVPPKVAQVTTIRGKGRLGSAAWVVNEISYRGLRIARIQVDHNKTLILRRTRCHSQQVIVSGESVKRPCLSRSDIEVFGCKCFMSRIRVPKRHPASLRLECYNVVPAWREFQ